MPATAATVFGVAQFCASRLAWIASTSAVPTATPSGKRRERPRSFRIADAEADTHRKLRVALRCG